ncbi:hypothetical protein LTR17_002942 [Elasticomyces elasticus]|nr:hypothetical protein LTR17_002942 [Elasticomyces elasticus]
MPTLEQITCSIELGSSNAKLKEYGARYSDGTVETFIAIPETGVPFVIHIESKGYIALRLPAAAPSNHPPERRPRPRLRPPLRHLLRTRTRLAACLAICMPPLPSPPPLLLVTPWQEQLPADSFACQESFSARRRAGRRAHLWFEPISLCETIHGLDAGVVRCKVNADFAPHNNEHYRPSCAEYHSPTTAAVPAFDYSTGKVKNYDVIAGVKMLDFSPDKDNHQDAFSDVTPFDFAPGWNVTLEFTPEKPKTQELFEGSATLDFSADAAVPAFDCSTACKVQNYDILASTKMLVFSPDKDNDQVSSHSTSRPAIGFAPGYRLRARLCRGHDPFAQVRAKSKTGMMAAEWTAGNFCLVTKAVHAGRRRLLSCHEGGQTLAHGLQAEYDLTRLEERPTRARGMSYKRLADTRWACTSHDNDVRLTTRQGPPHRCID